MRVRARVLVMSIACLALAGCGSRDETTVPKSQATMSVVVPAGAASTALIAGAEKAELFRKAGLAVKAQRRGQRREERGIAHELRSHLQLELLRHISRLPDIVQTSFVVVGGELGRRAAGGIDDRRA